jgi:hypothetical protein
MKKGILLTLAAGLALVAGCAVQQPNAEAAERYRMQLNWLHDPTFVAEYKVAQDEPDLPLNIAPGGPNVFPVAEVKGRRSHFAVVGADIFLRALSADIRDSGKSDLLAIFVEFQRNPVGWILHPEAADQLGLSGQNVPNDARQLNDWLFNQIAEKRVTVGDKRGTESTAIWLAWVKLRGLQMDVPVIPVGFDSAVVLSAPKMIFPVYLNEEPYKLTKRIGRSVLVFDPAADGVRAYGNVIITTKSFAASNPSAVRLLQKALTKSWRECRDNVGPCVDLVLRYYTGADRAVVTQQLAKTVEFAFFETENPGSMDLQPGGRWDQTLQQIKRSGVLPAALDLAQLKEHLLEP